jgi:hypothetical protein
MNVNQPSPQAAGHHGRAADTVVTERRLKHRGLSDQQIADRCGPGGPWQQVLPQVYLLHPGPPSSQERVRAALLYAGRDPRAPRAMVTGPAALALYGFACVPALAGLPRIDVLIGRHRRLRDAGDVALHRADELPQPRDVAGVPCAPPARALADAVAALDDVDTVRVLFAEAVRRGHCEAQAVIAELTRGGLLEAPHVCGATDVLRAENRALAEERLYAMVRRHRLPDPVWNVRLTLPGGPPLGGVDAYWPEHAVALVIEACSCPKGGTDSWSARHRERLEALGITVLPVTADALRDAEQQQAGAVLSALMASGEGAPAAYVVVTPR